MPKRLTLQQLDRVGKADPERGLEIIDKRADRKMSSRNPLERLAGELTKQAVEDARDRLRRNQGH